MPSTAWTRRQCNNRNPQPYKKAGIWVEEIQIMDMINGNLLVIKKKQLRNPRKVTKFRVSMYNTFQGLCISFSNPARHVNGSSDECIQLHSPSFPDKKIKYQCIICKICCQPIAHKIHQMLPCKYYQNQGLSKYPSRFPKFAAISMTHKQSSSQCTEFNSRIKLVESCK